MTMEDLLIEGVCSEMGRIYKKQRWVVKKNSTLKYIVEDCITVVRARGTPRIVELGSFRKR